MRVMLLGPGGFIGSAVLAALKSEGHQVVAVTRATGGRLQAGEWITLDIARATKPEDWLSNLPGIDAVVNCAGLLQDTPGEAIAAVHRDGVAALFAACAQAGVRRVVHVSAIGADRNQLTAFSRTKFEGDKALMKFDLDWVILRPSVVVGEAAYGGSALLRGLAALPMLPVMPNTGPLQIVQRDELVKTILFFIRPEAPARVALDVAGPDRLSFSEAVLAYRRWLGWPEPRLVQIPAGLSRVLFRLGDFAGLLGWRPPIRSTAEREMAFGAVGDNSAWRGLTGIEPRSLAAALASEPASVQERWFAQLYFLKAAGFLVFAAFWIVTGLISLGPGWEIGRNLMLEGGVGEPLASLSVVAGALADIAIGTALAFRRTARIGLYAALAISIFYVVAGTILVPRLWAEPLGPMLKIFPIMVLNLFLLAVRSDR
ncbi:MAG TPA: SDR family oxidoreductase [Propylenella sp.]|nr:SDR family oxidoreductase [Propylenella sp.]